MRTLTGMKAGATADGKVVLIFERSDETQDTFLLDHLTCNNLIEGLRDALDQAMQASISPAWQDGVQVEESIRMRIVEDGE